MFSGEIVRHHLFGIPAEHESVRDSSVLDE